MRIFTPLTVLLRLLSRKLPLRQVCFRNLPVLFISGIAYLLFAVLPVQAAVVQINVNMLSDVVSPIDGKCSLREALLVSNASNGIPSGAVAGECSGIAATDSAYINLQEGTYPLLMGNYPVISRFVTIAGQGAGTIIDGLNTYRVFEISSPGEDQGIQLLSLTIYRAKYLALSVNRGENATLISVDFLENKSTRQGAAIYINGGGLSASFCKFTGNETTSAIGGGAIYIANNADVTINRSSFVGNIATNGEGGAIRTRTGAVTDTEVTLSTFSDNRAIDGGAIYLGSQSRLIMTSSTLSENQVELWHSGGGLYFEDATITMNNTVISDNHHSALYRNDVDGWPGGVIQNSSANFIRVVENDRMPLSDGIEHRNVNCIFLPTVNADYCEA